MATEKKWKILGQDPEVLKAMLANLISWFISTLFPSILPYLLPHCREEEEDIDIHSTPNKTKCISIGRPGGLEQLRLVNLKDGIVTCGYNISHFCQPPFSPAIENETIPNDCVIIKNECFSVNYADCTIRWGLYESANRFVGWPIVPGFDIAGTIESVGGDANNNDDMDTNNFSRGDRVFGCTLFGGYSNRVLVPKIQLRKIPNGLSFAEAACLPAVSLTALYALNLAGHYFSKTDGSPSKLSNRAILIHSAAGGVGSMLVQMSKLLKISPIVGVVGSTSKVGEAKSLGCDVVIDKSKENLWNKAEEASPQGYSAIMDANGVSTLQQSYDHLTPTGRLVVFGFHSNLPMGKTMLSPIEWIRMAKKMTSMPKFDPLDMVTSNKSVLGFNLSFFADEREIVSELFHQVWVWLSEGSLRCPRVTTMDISEIAEAHQLLQSGSSVGKIVIKT